MPNEVDERSGEFARELAGLLNRYSAENGSDTPDHVLADYLIRCLAAYDGAVRRRERWLDRHRKGVPSA